MAVAAAVHAIGGHERSQRQSDRQAFRRYHRLIADLAELRFIHHARGHDPALLKSGAVDQGQAAEPAIFLDRDGVLNRKVAGGYVLSYDDFEFNAPLLHALSFYSRKNVKLIVITNQRCVARGLVSAHGMSDLMNAFSSALLDYDVILDGWYCCPHGEDCCSCRKPQPGLILEAVSDFSVDIKRSCMIGDCTSDLIAGAKAGLSVCIRYNWDEPDGVLRVKSMLGALYGN